MAFNLRDQLNIYVRSELYQFVLADGQAITITGVSQMGDIPAELWYFDTNSTAIDDGVTVIQPSAVPSGVSGRYLRHMVQADWNALSNKPTLFSGAYSDLTGKPTIPNAQVQSDWNAVSGIGVILNKPSIPTLPTRSFNNAPGRSLTTGTGATGFQVSSTRDSIVNYSAVISTTVSLTGNSTGAVVLEICATNSATPGDWVEVGRVSSGQSGTLVIGLVLNQTGGGQIGCVIPAGYYAKIRTINLAGTPTFSILSAQEVLI